MKYTTKSRTFRRSHLPISGQPRPLLFLHETLNKHSNSKRTEQPNPSFWLFLAWLKCAPASPLYPSCDRLMIGHDAAAAAATPTATETAVSAGPEALNGYKQREFLYRNAEDGETRRLYGRTTRHHHARDRRLKNKRDTLSRRAVAGKPSSRRAGGRRRQQPLEQPPPPQLPQEHRLLRPVLNGQPHRRQRQLALPPPAPCSVLRRSGTVTRPLGLMLPLAGDEPARLSWLENGRLLLLLLLPIALDILRHSPPPPRPLVLLRPRLPPPPDGAITSGILLAAGETERKSLRP